MLTRPICLAAGITAALLAGGIALTACTEATPSPAKTHAAATNVPGLPAGVSQATALPTDIPNDATLRANVSLRECAATQGGWKASGTIRNPSTSAITTVITVFFTTDKATVISTAQTRVTVKAHGKESWAAQNQFSAPTTTLCVLRGAGRTK